MSFYPAFIYFTFHRQVFRPLEKVSERRMNNSEMANIHGRALEMQIHSNLNSLRRLRMIKMPGKGLGCACCL